MNLSGGVIGEGTRQESPGLIAYISAQDGITPQQAAGNQPTEIELIDASVESSIGLGRRKIQFDPKKYKIIKA